MPSPARVSTRVAAPLAAIAVLLTGMAATAAAAPAQTPPGAPAVSYAPTQSTAWLARVVYRTIARATPGPGARALMAVRPVSSWGGPQQLLVLGVQTAANGREWVKVRLDVRPNGDSVWLDANDLVLSETHWRIAISRAQRRLRVYWNGRVDRSWRVVVGKPATPTPGGLYAVAAKLRQPDTNAFVGSWVLPLTAHSNVLMSFEGGDGQIAMHGRGGASLADPLGSALSHGCVRMDNEMIAWLAARVPIGTPVKIS